MDGQKAAAVTVMGVVVTILWRAVLVRSAIDCTTVVSLVSTCSTFVTYGSPDPIPGSPCCEAVGSLNSLVDSTNNRQSLCRCLMGLITTYNPDATAIATLPGFCGVFLGFTIEPYTDCNSGGVTTTKGDDDGVELDGGGCEDEYRRRSAVIEGSDGECISKKRPEAISVRFPTRGSPMTQLWPVPSLSGGEVQNRGGGTELAGDFGEQDDFGENFARYSTEAWIWQSSENFGAVGTFFVRRFSKIRYLGKSTFTTPSRRRFKFVGDWGRRCSETERRPCLVVGAQVGAEAVVSSRGSPGGDGRGFQCKRR
ncbi:hypothetical protein U1Q18_004473 [Sarracenia purpurea var. burkii]